MHDYFTVGLNVNLGLRFEPILANGHVDYQSKSSISKYLNQAFFVKAFWAEIKTKIGDFASEMVLKSSLQKRPLLNNFTFFSDFSLL